MIFIEILNTTIDDRDDDDDILFSVFHIIEHFSARIWLLFQIMNIYCIFIAFDGSTQLQRLAEQIFY